jgi:hypothetical protein
VPLKDKGFDIIPPPKNSKLEELRRLAYGDWLNILNECQDPGAELPHGQLIDFEMAKVIKRDNCSQIKLGRPGAVPEGINSEHHMRYVPPPRVRPIHFGPSPALNCQNVGHLAHPKEWPKWRRKVVR